GPAERIPGSATAAENALCAAGDEFVRQSKPGSAASYQTSAPTASRYGPVSAANNDSIQAALSPPRSAQAVSATMTGLPNVRSSAMLASNIRGTGRQPAFVAVPQLYVSGPTQST